MAPPQIKQDLNRSGWETTDFPSVCENCLPENPYVQMVKEDYGAECKLCTRPFTIFRWKANRTSRQQHTNICLTCARLKNCCQTCMLDLSFGLPLAVRDAALKMVAPGPNSSINREYYAQNHERDIEEGRGPMEEYEKTDEKARDLLRRLANSEPYHKKQRRLEAEEEEERQKKLESGEEPKLLTGPVRTHESSHRGRGAGPYARDSGRGGRGGARGGRAAGHIPTEADYAPPRDKNVTSLFVTGVEDDLPEHAIRTFFSPFGTLRSVVCSHRAHCAFINYATREAAETAAKACQGRAVIAGCPLRVGWGKPRPLDSMDNEERMGLARQGRDTAAAIKEAENKGQKRLTGRAPLAIEGESQEQTIDPDEIVVALPPGQDDVQYASVAAER